MQAVPFFINTVGIKIKGDPLPGIILSLPRSIFYHEIGEFILKLLCISSALDFLLFLLLNYLLILLIFAPTWGIYFF